jgi:hypothetical protein
VEMWKWVSATKDGTVILNLDDKQCQPVMAFGWCYLGRLAIGRE